MSNDDWPPFPEWMVWVKHHTGADLRYTVDFFEVLIVAFFAVASVWIIISILAGDGKNRHRNMKTIFFLLCFGLLIWIVNWR